MTHQAPRKIQNQLSAIIFYWTLDLDRESYLTVILIRIPSIPLNPPPRRSDLLWSCITPRFPDSLPLLA